MPNYILFFIGLFLLVSGSIKAQNVRIQPSCPLHILIAVDFSGSEWAYMDQIYTVLEDLTTTFELDEMNLKIGLITFNRGARLVLPLTANTQQMDAALAALPEERLVYATDIHSAIEVANSEFRLNSAPGIPKFFVLISDGDPHAHARGRGFRQDLVNMQSLKAGDPSNGVEPVQVFSLYTGGLHTGFGYDFDESVLKAAVDHMKALASGPESFLYFEEYLQMIAFFKVMGSCM